MKTLVAVRHAEAEEKQIFQNDFDRHLTIQGRIDAEMMGLGLQEKNIKPDLIIASPAQRTRETSEILAKNLACPLEHILLKERIYNGSSHDITDTLLFSDIPDEVETIFIIGHNPGISYFALHIARGLPISYLPPCGMVGVQTVAGHWADFSFLNSTFLFFDFP